MDTNDFTAQLNQAIPSGFQHILGLRVEATEDGPRAVFRVGSETWQLTATDPQRWQLHAPATGFPIWLRTDELTPSLLVLRTYRISQQDYADRTLVQIQLRTVFTLGDQAGQEIVLSAEAALELLDLLTVSEPELKHLIRGAEEDA